MAKMQGQVITTKLQIPAQGMKAIVNYGDNEYEIVTITSVSSNGLEWKIIIDNADYASIDNLFLLQVVTDDGSTFHLKETQWGKAIENKEINSSKEINFILKNGIARIIPQKVDKIKEIRDQFCDDEFIMKLRNTPTNASWRRIVMNEFDKLN